MMRYRVTLTFRFHPVHTRSFAGEDDAQYRSCFERTEALFEQGGQNGSVIDYVKTFDPLQLVQDLLLTEGTVTDAEWDPERFVIHFTVTTTLSRNELERTLRTLPLEDTEYEAMQDNGWIVFTRGPNNEIYDAWTRQPRFEYGVSDYRESPIVIVRQ